MTYADSASLRIFGCWTRLYYVTRTAYLQRFQCTKATWQTRGSSSNLSLFAHAPSQAQMPQQVKFTPFGIPYITEFENVSFVPQRRREELRQNSLDLPQPRHTFYSASPSLSSSTSSFCYIESPPPPPRFPSFSLRSASSLFKRKPAAHSTTEPPLWSTHSEDPKPLPPPPHSDVSETHGIYIQFPPEHIHPQMTRKERLVHLQKTISVAVLDAGMSRSPGNTTHPEEHSNENAVHRNRGYKTANALFCGTYGQLMTALEGAGLSAVPCVGEGLSGCE